MSDLIIPDPIVEARLCQLCNAAWPSTSQDQPWEQHRRMLVNGLVLNIGEVFGYKSGINTDHVCDGMIVSSKPSISTESHERLYSVLRFNLVKRGLGPWNINHCHFQDELEFRFFGSPNVVELNDERFSQIEYALNGIYKASPLTRGILNKTASS